MLRCERVRDLLRGGLGAWGPLLCTRASARTRSRFSLEPFPLLLLLLLRLFSRSFGTVDRCHRTKPPRSPCHSLHQLGVYAPCVTALRRERARATTRPFSARGSKLPSAPSLFRRCLCCWKSLEGSKAPGSTTHLVGSLGGDLPSILKLIQKATQAADGSGQRTPFLESRIQGSGYNAINCRCHPPKPGPDRSCFRCPSNTRRIRSFAHWVARAHHQQQQLRRRRRPRRRPRREGASLTRKQRTLHTTRA